MALCEIAADGEAEVQVRLRVAVVYEDDAVRVAMDFDEVVKMLDDLLRQGRTLKDAASKVETALYLLSRNKHGA